MADKDEYIWDVIWPEPEKLDELLETGWEPFGFAISPDGEGIVALRKLVTREWKNPFHVDSSRRPSF